jgi:hypothetical protein
MLVPCVAVDPTLGKQFLAVIPLTFSGVPASAATATSTVAPVPEKMHAEERTHQKDPAPVL